MLSMFSKFKNHMDGVYPVKQEIIHYLPKGLYRPWYSLSLEPVGVEVGDLWNGNGGACRSLRLEMGRESGPPEGITCGFKSM